MTTMRDLKDTYDFLGKLSEGSGGVVYKAYHKRLRKNVVLKRIKTKSSSMEINRKEVDMLKNLNHMYLPKVLDFLEIENDLYTVMDFIPGQSFQTLIANHVRFNENDLIRYALQISSALHYLHQQTPPIIHCDVKPANIMLKPDGNICLIDFNISFALYDDFIMGYSNGYSSPELYEYATSSKRKDIILKKPGIINEKTDIYSLGATLYHIATHRKISNDIESDIEYLKTLTSKEFAVILSKALQKDPKDRYESAYAMYHALENITKANNRYIQLLKKQAFIKKGLYAGLAVSICLCGFSVFMLRQEKMDAYIHLVDQQVTYRQQADYIQQEETFGKASEMMPENLQSYYQNAYSLYKQGKYEECSNFIVNRILANEKIKENQENEENVYYLLADSFFWQKQYKKALETYSDLFQMDHLEPIYYRDHAITLAYANQNEQANQVLDVAIEKGLTEDSIFYAKAEIENALNHKETAIENMNKALAISESQDILSHGYVQLSTWYEDINDLPKAKLILETAKTELPATSQIQVLESLAQINIDIANKSGNEKAREDAISTLYEIIDRGWDSYQTYDNLVIQYEKLGNTEKAKEILAKMISQYGEDYNIFKRYAFIEIDVQNLLPNKSRDYTLFKEYYSKAKSLYENAGVNDMEMDVLTSQYNDVQQKGW